MSADENGSMREAMPQVTEFIDACRDAFGVAEVDGWIRAGLKDGTFWAEEGGYTVGVRQAESADRVNAGDWLRGSELIELDRKRRVAVDAKGRG